ncbi:ABC transporter substrate-binding protein [Yinghuangia seranimata]|uniref:ABC transporter substrate-binding protein n=1 Tax=Yinghuangia seranimata TaxID=408067 RepID=UPI00248D2F4C|nr:ABC transporter substrate-binding protein [Yinghuangia seranimata]MDI2128108.1 ABC transporter substrate-binding protein [Yinghuangia seranimata]
MKPGSGTRAVCAVLAALALTVTACSTKDDKKDDGGGANPSAPGSPGGKVKTGPGVTDTEIHIGELSDLSGPYAPLGKSVTNAEQLYFDQINAAGGICGRKVVMDVKDHGYDAQKARTAYTEISGKVVGISQMVGSAIVTQLQDDIERDGLLTLPQAWASTLLGKKVIQVTATTYDVEIINGFEYLARTAPLASGDKVGHIYTDDEFGANSALGVKYAAQAAGVSVVDQKIKPTDQDMTAAVTALKSAGVKAIIVSASPRQVGPVMVVTESAGFKVPVLSHSVGFHPQLLAVAAAPMEARLAITSPVPAISSTDLPAVAKLGSDYLAKFPGSSLDQGVMSGYAAAGIFGEDLKAACAAGDLTREGLVAAHRKQTGMDLGLGLKLDFSSNAKPPSYQTFILKVDKSKPGGLVTVEPAHEVPGAKSYTLPKTG